LLRRQFRSPPLPASQYFGMKHVNNK
jgi:hypothetical protein